MANAVLSERMTPEELTALRKAARLTMVQLGTAIGMHRVMIGLMERGNAPITLRTELAVRYVCERLAISGEGEADKAIGAPRLTSLGESLCRRRSSSERSSSRDPVPADR